jgi:EAL domain-containing protein (putative c-di-GMP-specific phosphodiesterase class I)
VTSGWPWTVSRSLVRAWLDGDGQDLGDWVRWAARHKLPVVAEGIEDPAAVPRLREAGVRYGQGFVLGRPEPAEVWGARLAAVPAPTPTRLRGQGR